MKSVEDCPAELAVAIKEFWPPEEWDHAASISLLESGWDAFALNDTASRYGCGAVIAVLSGVKITAERSIGYFQINACNYPTWNAGHFYNARHNAGTAHALWVERGWAPWYFSAKKLGLLD